MLVWSASASDAVAQQRLYQITGNWSDVFYLGNFANILKDERAVVVGSAGRIANRSGEIRGNSGTSSDLLSVFFQADNKTGWATGADGAIVSTTDKGANWLPQRSGTTATLRSVYFSSDGRHGWAVGDNGTIVVTADGGANWQAQDSGTKASLSKVAFASDGQHGWTVGTDGA
ncbi:MAG: YCF48-related protein, partial [Steroidobacteraceae bacterium]